jgi:transposase
MRVFIGLDVSLAKTAIGVVDHDGGVQWQGKVPSGPGPLIKRLTEWHGNIELAGIAACPRSEWLHRALREAGISIVCIETRQAQRSLSSRPIKTDKNDARGIAEMMRLGHYRPVHVKSLRRSRCGPHSGPGCSSLPRYCKSRAPSEGC